MDQNNQFEFYQQEQPGEAAPATKNARYFRARAREKLKGNWVMTSVGGFLYTLLQGLSAMVGLIPMLIAVATGVVFDAISGTENPVFTVFAFLFGYALMFVGMFLVSGPLTVGYSRLHLDLMDGKPVEIGSLFSYFKKAYWKSVGLIGWQALIVFGFVMAMFVVAFISGFVSALLDSEILFPVLFFPLLIAWVAAFAAVLYRYAMAPFILAEYPEMRAIDALRSSAVLMKGRKWKLFCLECSFIGWFLLYIPATLLTCGIGGMIGEYVLMAYMQTSHAAFYHDAANRDAAKEVEFPSIDPDDYVAE